MRRSTAPLLALVALLALVSAPVALAKEWLEAELDAPIAMGTPGATVILVGLTVALPDPESGEMLPVEGSPIMLLLTGPDGDTTRALAAPDGVPGHYTARIAIPDGGARDLQIGIDGSDELPVLMARDPFTFGPITARTAQLAPPIAAPAPAKPAPPGTVPARGPAPVAVAAPAPDVAPALVASLAGLAALAVIATLLARRRRAAVATPRSA